MKKIFLLGISAAVVLLSVQGCYVGFAPGREDRGGYGWYERGNGYGHGYRHGHGGYGYDRGHGGQHWDGGYHHR